METDNKKVVLKFFDVVTDEVCVCVFVCRLLYLLQQSSSSLELRTECAVVLGSLAMGTENNIKSLVDCHIIPALLQGSHCHFLSLSRFLSIIHSFRIYADI